MTQQERVKIGEHWLGLAQMYGREIPRAALTIMINAVADLEPSLVIGAFTKWAQTSKLNRHPLPADIRDIVAPEQNISSEAVAREIAARITGAVVKFGWPNANAAESFIGPEGWAAVQRQGGWSHLCQNLGVTINPTTFQAQVRDQLESNIKYGVTAIDARLISGPPMPTQISEILKLAFAKKEIEATKPDGERGE
jgi:hypothetical protein